jgi:hypothetical protein
MAGDDAARLVATEATAALQQCLNDKMATLQAIEKKAAEAHAHICVVALLLKEEQGSTAVLEAEAGVATLKLAPTTASS